MDQVGQVRRGPLQVNSMALEGNDGSEDILQAVLDQAFSPPPSRRESVQVINMEAGGSSHETLESPAEPASGKRYIFRFHRRLLVRRQRRNVNGGRHFVLLRERKLQRRKAAAHFEESVAEPTEQEHDAGWETVSHKKDNLTESTAASEVSASPSPADSRDLVTGETNRQLTAPAATSTSTLPAAGIPRNHSQTDTAGVSQKWEEIQSSVTSSFPSMSYPERTETPSPSREPAPSPPAPLSATLAIFDSTLSTRTRVTALFSSLAINLLLPFVNGVMLGFGEIFAKNVVLDWFGWKPTGPGHVAATTGISASTKTPWGQRQRQKQS
ncbi:hypothetical protein FPV67DRAFT_1667182 [Lyophyllum atratum]|nr:hypothetical protein FPV67DRAFT_1667182 [Lyophyllum atratum]